MSVEPHTVHHITLHGPWMTACGVDASPGQLSAGEAWSSDWPDVTCRNCLQAEIAALRAWKASALAVEREWDVQKLSRICDPERKRMGESCRKVIAEAIEEIPRLRSLAAAGEKVAEALESCIAALTDPRNGTWPWVENGHMHEHFRDVAESAKSALSAFHAAKSQSEP